MTGSWKPILTTVMAGFIQFGMVAWAVDNPSIELILNQTEFAVGDEFRLQVRISNPSDPITIKEMIVLDIAGTDFFFWPGWTRSFEYNTKYLPADYFFTEDMFYFGWPDDAGAMDNLRFWAAMLDLNNNLYGDYDVVQWSFR